MPPNFEPKYGFSPNDPSFFETLFARNASLWKCEPYTRIHLILEYPPGSEQSSKFKQRHEEDLYKHKKAPQNT